MFALHLIQSFLPISNPLGFGASDFMVLVLAALLAALAFLWRPLSTLYARSDTARLAQNVWWPMLFLAVLPVALRLLLLSHHPVPVPDLYDEFGHLLVADTLRHFRLANPAHPLHQFFETFFVLQEPAYSPIYPVGQGMLLALGWTIFGVPWAGVLLAAGAFCGLCYWMLRGWTTPGWALVGGCLAVIEFGPLNLWTNSYWGGDLSAAAGCLVFGALPRVRAGGGLRYAFLLGLGLAIYLLTRPYESIFLAVSVILFLLPGFRFRALLPALAVVTLAVLPAIGLTLLQNKRVTGSWTTLPYVLSQYQYGVPAALTIQTNPVPHNQLTAQQELDYKMQLGFRGPAPESLGSYLRRLVYRIRFYRFFFLPPLYLALPAFLPAIRERRYLYVLLCVTLFALGINFFPAFQYHYMAAVTCLFILISVTGLERLTRLEVSGYPAGVKAVQVILLLCAGQFVFLYGADLFRSGESPATERRATIRGELDKLPGKLVVFVRYWPPHLFQDEWVYNGADIDGSRVVWARDLGAAEDEKLRRYYPDRSAWLLEPDARPPRLTPYQPEPAAPPLPPTPAPPQRNNGIEFLPIP
jgi:hypothetical protein